MPSKYALVIGNSEYSDSKLARLRTPTSDVNALADVLKDPSLGGFDSVEVLLNQDSATARRTISRFFSNKKREDLLLLYFSGHGVLDDRGRLYLAVKDTEHGLLRGTSLESSFITDEMDNCSSNRQILILDCCHSGAFARGTKGILGRSVGTGSAFMGNGYGRIVLTATDSTEYAWEGDELVGSKQNSVFTHYLIQGIKTGEADLNNDGVISIDELYDFARDRINDSTSKQTPGKWSFKQQGEILIAKNPHANQNSAVEPVVTLSETIKHSDLVGPSLAIQILKSGIAGGFITALLLIYPLYVYMPSRYFLGWYRSSAILSFLFMFLSLVPPAWSGWLMARRAKSGAEAIFLGSQAGGISTSIAYLCIIALAAGIFAFQPVLKLIPNVITDSYQLNKLFAFPIISTFTYAFYTWVVIGFAGLVLGSIGCLLKLSSTGEKKGFFSFNLTFDISWWQTIVASAISFILILSLSTAVYELLRDQVIGSAALGNYQISASEKKLLDLFPSLCPLISFLFIMAIASISTFGSTPSEPSQQRTIAVYALITALLPWINPLERVYIYLFYGVYSVTYLLLTLPCVAASLILIMFSFRLLKTAGWGKIGYGKGKSFLEFQLANAFLFIILAAPAISLGAFYYSVVLESIMIFGSSSSIHSIKGLVANGFQMQIGFYLIAILSIWILYTICGLLLKPLPWAFNGVVSLFPKRTNDVNPDLKLHLQEESPSNDSSANETAQKAPLLKNPRFVTSTGIIALVLVLILGLRLLVEPTSPNVTPLQTPGFWLTAGAPTVPVFPVREQTTFGYSATQTVSAAFTEIALRQTIFPTSTMTATVTPITTLTPTGAMLRLDKSYPCREGPGSEYSEITPLAPGVVVPILARSESKDEWWLVMIKLSISENAVCWVEHGMVDGDTKNIPIISSLP